MPTTSYVSPTVSVGVVGARTDSAGSAVSDFSAEEGRLTAQMLTEGYLTPTAAFQVQAQAVPDMTVKVGSGTSKADHYVVAGEVAGQGNYLVRLDVASQNVTIDAADASQTRTDEIYLVVRDNVYDASSRALPQIGYRKGDLGGANPGVDSAWKASVLLARVTVAAAVTTITSGNISDQRTASVCVALPNLALALPASSTLAESVKAAGDANNRFELFADGYMKWGSGAAIPDVTLYRDSANVLRTDDTFRAPAVSLAGTDLQTTLNGKASTSHGHDPVGSVMTGTDRYVSRYYSASAQSIANNSDTPVSYGTTGVSGSWVTRAATGAGHYFTMNVSGVWSVTATVRFDTGSAGERYARFVRYDTGVQDGCTASGGYSDGVRHTINLHYTGFFSAGEWIYVEVFQNSGSTLNLEGAAQWKNISLALVRRCT